MFDFQVVISTELSPFNETCQWLLSVPLAGEKARKNKSKKIKTNEFVTLNVCIQKKVKKAKAAGENGECKRKCYLEGKQLCVNHGASNG